MPQTRIGISGWSYPGWRGKFYPKGLKPADQLPYVAARMRSVEINASFYRLQRPRCYQDWYRQTPDDFVFAVKGGRFVTHMKKLKDPAEPLANFFASGVLALEEKLGPILWQLPPNLGFDAERLERFFDALPRDTEQAAALAARHAPMLEGRSHVETGAKREIRHALEIRHRTFLVPEFPELLRRHRVALVFADTATKWPYAEDLTADFVYARLHGAEHLYASGYTDPQLDWWAERLRAWRSGSEPSDANRLSGPAELARSRDVFVYFDNDALGHAPFDAMRLAERL